MQRRQLFRSNGTTAGTVPVQLDGPVEVSNLLVANGRVYFTGSTTHDPSRRLTPLMEEKSARSSQMESDHSHWDIMRQINWPRCQQFDHLFCRFACHITSWTKPTWKTDGTSVGSVPALSLGADTPVDITDLTMLNGRLWFFATNPTLGQRSLYVSDGTNAGTIALRSFDSEGFFNITPPQFTALNGLVYFSAFTTKHGTELWQSDGTIRGTKLTADLNRGVNFNESASSSRPVIMGSQGNHLIFNADNDETSVKAHGRMRD